MDIEFEPELGELIDELFEIAHKERHIHSASKEVIEAINALWEMDESITSMLAKIASRYVISSFLLKSLSLIKRYANDVGFKEWLEEIYLPNCLELLKYDKAKNLEDVSRIANLADASFCLAKEYDRCDIDLVVLDSMFQFRDSLEE